MSCGTIYISDVHFPTSPLFWPCLFPAHLPGPRWFVSLPTAVGIWTAIVMHLWGFAVLLFQARQPAVPMGRIQVWNPIRTSTPSTMHVDVLQLFCQAQWGRNGGYPGGKFAGGLVGTSTGTIQTTAPSPRWGAWAACIRPCGASVKCRMHITRQHPNAIRCPAWDFEPLVRWSIGMDIRVEQSLKCRARRRCMQCHCKYPKASRKTKRYPCPCPPLHLTCGGLHSCDFIL
mmetsp:Transcript_57076/g.93855  ORF Transcript_57076/g.93855 Transcript_57076/m.93855 type:complete len:230 (+) Transcript_57076:641-1330(+)